MAILTGTSKNRFPSFEDPNAGIGALIQRGQKAVLDFFSQYQSWETNYVEDGVENIPGFSTVNKSFSAIKKPSKRKIITQSPKATVFVKKRMFSTLRNHYNVKLMGEKDKLFIRATKRLFQRKLEQLAFYESVSNIERAVDGKGFLHIDAVGDGFLNSILDLIENSFIALDVLGGVSVPKALEQMVVQEPALRPFVAQIQQMLRLRSLNQRSKSNRFTSWISDPLESDLLGLGSGVGVIELNQVDNFQTNVSLQPGGGSANFSIQDPYKIMLILEEDVEIALREAISEKDLPREQVSDITDRVLQRARILDDEINSTRRLNNESEINFQFLLGKDYVVGTVVRTGQEFTKNDISKITSNSIEAVKIAQVFDLLDSYIVLQKRAISLFQTVNEKYNDVRQRLRNEFVGHSIIQQMDMVHVFMNSNTKDDSTATTLPSNITDFVNAAGIQGDQLDISAVKAEHQEIAPDIPFFFYLYLRNRSYFREDGVQIFSGLVSTVNTSYRANEGVFSVSVSCNDNTHFLKMSKINTSPGLEQRTGMLEDPLTPFELAVDPATGLIEKSPRLSDENLQRLKYLRFNDGILAGERVTASNIWQDTGLAGKVKTYQHMPGMVYKWKEGIISETLNVNMRRPLDGTEASIADAEELYGITVQDNPFGGLDAADVMSILITGRPHNYSTFLKHALDLNRFSINATNQNKAYFNYLFDFLERQAHIRGSFVPSVNSPIDPLVAADAFRQQLVLEDKLSQLNKKRRELASAEDKRRKFTKYNREGAAIDGVETLVDGLGSRAADLDIEITKLKSEIADLMSGNQYGQNVDPANLKKVSFGVIGNETFANFTDDEIADTRMQLKYRVKKKPEDVRYNKDFNFFIVSEQYDSNTDIQAFARNLKDKPAELFDSQYQNPFDICVQAAESIGFEFFADSQGNLVFRPPEYNKTPLSLLLKMMYMQKAEGVSLAPKFLQELFKDRAQLLIDEITLVELQILENLILLSAPLTITSGSVDVSEVPLSLDATKNSDGDIFFSINIERLEKIINMGSIFTVEQQDELRAQVLDVDSESLGELSEALIYVQNAIYDIRGLHHKKVSVDIETKINAALEIQQNIEDKSDNASVNRLKLTNSIAQLVSHRQMLGKSLAGIRKNEAGFEINTEQSTSSLPIPSSVAAQISGFQMEAPSFPKFMHNLIENDLSNEDGWRSGKRFIIEDDVILSMDLSATTPEFNRIDVIGNQDFLNTQNGLLANLPVLWAGAVDYDSWRQFGYLQPAQVYRADFNSAETQCAPYAIFKLQEQRKRIHSGTITIVGNEFYQVGDVVYINNRSMLYYVENVSHSFSFGNASFVTTLELSLGRALGEYVPTSLDIIGKGMLATQRKAFGNIKSNRAAVGVGHTVHLGTLFISEGYNFLDDLNQTQIREKFFSDEQNQRVIRNAIVMSESKINRSESSFRIEIRTYFIDNTVDEFASVAFKNRALKLGRWAKEMFTTALQSDNETKLPNNKVFQIAPIDISTSVELTEREKKLHRFPSAEAWSGINPVKTSDGVGLPLNAIDVFFVAEKTTSGDTLNLEETDIVV